jgi:hypothetical protein
MCLMQNTHPFHTRISTSDPGGFWVFCGLDTHKSGGFRVSPARWCQQSGWVGIGCGLCCFLANRVGFGYPKNGFFTLKTRVSSIQNPPGLLPCFRAAYLGNPASHTSIVSAVSGRNSNLLGLQEFYSLMDVLLSLFFKSLTENTSLFGLYSSAVMQTSGEIKGKSR